MTLQKIIDKGSEDCSNGHGDSLYAACFMAYHAGISKGHSFTGQRWLAAVERGLLGAQSEHMHHVASRHIIGPISGDGDINGSEAAELLSFDYPSAANLARLYCE